MSVELQDRDPEINEQQVPQNTELISFSVVADDVIIPGSIKAYVNEMLAFENEAFVDPFDGSGADFDITSFGLKDGYEVTLDYTGTTFDAYTTITLHVLAEDDAANSLDEYYSFQIEDVEGVRISNTFPANGAQDVDEDTLVVAKVSDAQSGVDLSNTSISIGGVLAYQGGFISPFDGYWSAVVWDSYDGYTVTIDNTGTYPSGGSLTVVVTSKDNEGN